MHRHFTLMLALLLLTIPTFAQSTRPVDDRADALARAVGKAAGADAWGGVKRIGFTFNVEQDGKPVLSAKHDWDVKAHRDTVTWGDKTVAVDLANPPADGDGKAAFARWTNDSYWLLMPLKLLDPGVNRRYEGSAEVDGKTYEVLHISFGDVGLTPGDQYRLFIDPATHRLAWFDYMPNPQRTVRASWEDYQTVGGLTLSTNHRLGDRRVYFTDLAVERE